MGNQNLIDAAAAVRAEVILMSVVGAASDHPIGLFRAKHAAEERLKVSGARWTIVRATAFVELWAEIMKRQIVFGRGENPINFVSVSDVATALERAVLDPDCRGGVIEVGGPENVTFNQLAELLGQIRGRTAKVRHVPRPVLRLMAPFSRQVAAALAMDTIDMSYRPPITSVLADCRVTDLQRALTRAVSAANDRVSLQSPTLDGTSR